MLYHHYSDVNRKWFAMIQSVVRCDEKWHSLVVFYFDRCVYAHANARVKLCGICLT